MEMWCPDDIGRDSWDWVGPLAWGEHASTPQSGVEAPRLLKTEPSPDCLGQSRHQPFVPGRRGEGVRSWGREGVGFGEEGVGSWEGAFVPGGRAFVPGERAFVPGERAFVPLSWSPHPLVPPSRVVWLRPFLANPFWAILI